MLKMLFIYYDYISESKHLWGREGNVKCLINGMYYNKQDKNLYPILQKLDGENTWGFDPG